MIVEETREIKDWTFHYRQNTTKIFFFPLFNFNIKKNGKWK